jgi:hypothetical protein
VSDVIEMHFDVSLKVPIQCVVNGNFVSIGVVVFMNPAGGVGAIPVEEQPPGAGPSGLGTEPSITLDPPVAPESTPPPEPPLPVAVPPAPMLVLDAPPVELAVLAPPAPVAEVVSVPPAPMVTVPLPLPAVLLDDAVPPLPVLPVGVPLVPLPVPVAGFCEVSLPQAVAVSSPKIQARRVRVMTLLGAAPSK